MIFILGDRKTRKRRSGGRERSKKRNRNTEKKAWVLVDVGEGWHRRVAFKE